MADKKLLTSAVSTLAALSFSLGSQAADPAQVDPFEAEQLSGGFMVTQIGFAEGACGEGTCGEGSCGEDDKDDEKDDDKDEEGACGEGACGEGTCGA